jgi:hypothetical protein
MTTQLRGTIMHMACPHAKRAYAISLALACCALTLDAQQQVPGLKDTVLYRLFDKYPYDTGKKFDAQYPRVALTVLSTPGNHAQAGNFTPTGGVYPKPGCFTLRAKVWSSKTESQDVGPFQWCSPRDVPPPPEAAPLGSERGRQRGTANRLGLVAGVAGDSLLQWIDGAYMYAISEETTHSVRTDGPIPPDKPMPDDPAHTRYFGSYAGGFSTQTGDGAMVLLMLNAMDFDMNVHPDRRVWIVSFLSGPGPEASPNVQPAPGSAAGAPPSSPYAPANPPSPSSSPTTQGADALGAIWQSDAYAGQTFRFKPDGAVIYVYGGQQDLLGTLQGKGKNGAIDMYEGLVRVAPVTQCPAGRGLMQIKNWNDNRLDAKIETPVRNLQDGGVICG